MKAIINRFYYRRAVWTAKSCVLNDGSRKYSRSALYSFHRNKYWGRKWGDRTEEKSVVCSGGTRKRRVDLLFFTLLFYSVFLGIEKQFEYFCNTLKEQHITWIEMIAPPGRRLIKEHCLRLLDILNSMPFILIIAARIATKLRITQQYW